MTYHSRPCCSQTCCAQWHTQPAGMSPASQAQPCLCTCQRPIPRAQHINKGNFAFARDVRAKGILAATSKGIHGGSHVDMHTLMEFLEEHGESAQHGRPSHVQHRADRLALGCLKEGGALGALPARTARDLSSSNPWKQYGLWLAGHCELWFCCLQVTEMQASAGTGFTQVHRASPCSSRLCRQCLGSALPVGSKNQERAPQRLVQAAHGLLAGLVGRGRPATGDEVQDGVHPAAAALGRRRCRHRAVRARVLPCATHVSAQGSNWIDVS